MKNMKYDKFLMLPENRNKKFYVVLDDNELVRLVFETEQGLIYTDLVEVDFRKAANVFMAICQNDFDPDFTLDLLKN